MTNRKNILQKLGAQPRRRKPAFVTHDNKASLCTKSFDSCEKKFTLIQKKFPILMKKLTTFINTVEYGLPEVNHCKPM